MTTNLLFPLLTLLMFAASCKKDHSEPQQTSGPIIGKWNFISLHSETKQYYETILMGDKFRAETTMLLNSTDYTGYITVFDKFIEIDKLTYNYLGSTVDEFYKNGVLTNADNTPTGGYYFSPYMLIQLTSIGPDSITYAPGHDFFNNVMDDNPFSAGAKYSISGNTLTITGMSSRQDSSNGFLETKVATAVFKKS